MSTQSVGLSEGPFFHGLIDRVKWAISRWWEMSRLDSREIETVARDLSISPAEFMTLMSTSSGSLEQLSKRLAYAGLSEEVLAACHPDELRDLRRVCSQCSAKARCARDLRHKRMATPSKYCPNELTLALLVREVCHERLVQVPSASANHS